MREFKGDWRDLFFGFRIALDLRKIFLSFIGAVFTVAGVIGILGLAVEIDNPSPLAQHMENYRIADAAVFVLDWGWQHLAEPVLRLVAHPSLALFPDTVKGTSNLLEWGTALALAIWIVLIWSKFGGAIARIAAVEIAKDERITTKEALEYSRKKWSSFFWSPLSVLIAFCFFFFVNSLGGLVGRIPYAGPVIVALLSIFAFLGGFIMLLIAIGGLFGWPLMAPALAAEGTDAFDAVSRAFSYVYTRPWHYLFYWIVSTVYGALSVSFVWLFTLLMVKLTFVSAQTGMGMSLDKPVNILFHSGSFEAVPVVQIILAVTLGVIVLLLFGMAFSYSISFVYSARSLMYFILRKAVDNTEMTEVYLEDEEDEDLFEEDFGEEKEEEKKEGEQGAETPRETGEAKAATEENPPPSEPEKAPEENEDASESEKAAQ